jgi:hypothetical protein
VTAPLQADAAISTLAQTIQLSLAPVFLLSGVAGLLAVLNTRLLRVVDRTRHLQSQKGPDPERDEEISVLLKRRFWINRAITSCTYCALLVAGVVALLFTGSALHIDVSIFVSVVFVGAMVTLILGLLSFLREIHMAIGLLRPVGEARVVDK